MTDADIKRYVKERDKAALACDVEKFKAFHRKWEKRGVLGAVPLPKDDKVIEITMRKVICNSAGTPRAAKVEALRWLLAHGCSPYIF